MLYRGKHLNIMLYVVCLHYQFENSFPPLFSFQLLAVEDLETAAIYMWLYEFRGKFRYYQK